MVDKSYVCSNCGKGGLTEDNKSISLGPGDIYRKGSPTGMKTARFGKICEKCSGQNKSTALEDSLTNIGEFVEESPKIITGLTPEFPQLYIESESERIETTKQSLGPVLYKNPDVRIWIGRVNTTSRKNQHTLYDF